VLRAALGDTEPLVCFSYLATQGTPGAPHATNDVDCHRGRILLQQPVFHYLFMLNEAALNDSVDHNLAKANNSVNNFGTSNYRTEYNFL
jgi:hypothetical protein